MLKANEIRNMTRDEIARKLEGLRKELYNLRTEAIGGRIERPHLIRQTRRDIARCETVLRELENAEPKKT
jgi:large subunit ribosomal protein L29